MNTISMVEKHDMSVEMGARLIKGSLSKSSSEITFYHSNWREKEIDTIGINKEKVLLFHDNKGICKIEEGYNSENLIIRVRSGKIFKDHENNFYEINPNDINNYGELLKTLYEKEILPDNIIYIWSEKDNSSKTIKGNLDKSVYSIFYLIHSLMQLKVKNNFKIMFLHNNNKNNVYPFQAAISGFFRTAKIERPDYLFKTVEIGSENAKVDYEILMNEFLNDDANVRLFDGKRYIRYYSETEQTLANRKPVFKENGVYLITGGLGEIGFSIAKHLVMSKNARVVLTGRTEADIKTNKKLSELVKLNADVMYIKADISKKVDIVKLIERIKNKYNVINGIFHCAGIINDAFIYNKTIAEVKNVISAKVYGTKYLFDEVKDENIDFFVMSSSIVSVMGNVGQADYGFANSYMDHFAAVNDMKKTRVISVNWTLWEEGGMKVTKEWLQYAEKKIGLEPIYSDEGIEALDFIINSSHPQVIVFKGDNEKFDKYINSNLKKEGTPQLEKEYENEEKEEMFGEAVEYLKTLIANVANLSVGRIRLDEPFDKYGIDSLMIMELNREMEKDFGDISKTLFFENRNISELAGYFAKNYADDLCRRPLEKGKKEVMVVLPNEEPDDGLTEIARKRFVPDDAPKNQMEEANSKISGDIAIIGISGTYPMSKNIDEFWENLKAGKDCITEVPGERWDYSLYYDRDGKNKGKVYSKWGGFIEDYNKFDPLFFNISPKEAEKIDPQERLFLQSCWHTMEDAGYTRERLHKNDVGVFAGVMYSDYQLYGAEESQKGNTMALGISNASIANRVSYCLDLNGPSVTLDTMCSSSLTSIHFARESILRGECDMAFAGAVNLTIHPNKYIMLSQGKFVSSDGRCRSFGEGGDGYVPGEGVGTLLLKTLEKAVEDNDRIYAVIKSSGINHGGKTNGFTVPNPNAQAAVISGTMKKANIHPLSISYIEAHGTGTALGDPIELTGLTKAFEQHTSDRQFCPIGSVKSNIGHLEAAAGVAGITKIIIQMKNKTLVPSLHSKNLNPNLDFKSSPFYVQQELAEWKKPTYYENGTCYEYPRRASISCFGAGGSNSHLILEEFEQNDIENEMNEINQIIVLSAKNRERLKDYAKELYDYLVIKTGANQMEINPMLSLRDIAYTLQMGREAMEERVAFIVNNISELKDKLYAYYCQENGTGDFAEGNVKKAEEDFNIFFDDEEGRQYVQSILTKKKFDKIAKIWTMGINIDWNIVYSERESRIISLPCYPFAKEIHWANVSKPISLGKNEASDIMMYEKGWKEGSVSFFNSIEGSKIILINNQTAAIGLQLKEMLINDDVILVHTDEFNNNEEIRDYYINSSDANQGRQVVCDILSTGKGVGAFIDISDLREEPYDKNTAFYGKLAFVQELVRQSSFRGVLLLHITRGLQQYKNEFSSLSGAGFASLIKILGGEYEKVFSRTIDIDYSIAHGNEIAFILYKEMSYQGNVGEICYRKGKRYVPFLREICIDQRDGGAYSQKTKDKVMVITGGTRGIGAQVAKHFVDAGFKKIVLMGVQNLPERSKWDEIIKDNKADANVMEKLKFFEELMLKGVTLEVYSGSLTDKGKLEGYFDEVRNKLGKIGSVIHCAGLLGTGQPAFINKDIEKINEVLEPKIQGLEILDEVFMKDDIEMFLLFSSVSGLMPKLAVGLSDYGTANAYMDFFAGYQNARGKSYYQSIVWPRWKDVGMDVAISQVYMKSGLLAHSTASGLKMLDTAIEYKNKVCVMPCCIDKNIFNADEILYSKVNDVYKEMGNIKQVRKKDHGSATNLDTISQLKEIFAVELKIPIEKIEEDTSFQEFGVDSILLGGLVKRIEEWTDTTLDPTMLLEFSTIRLLSQAIEQKYPNISKDKEMPEVNVTILDEGRVIREEAKENRKIAVIGMACHFPGADNKEEFWDNLVAGKSSIREVPDARWDTAKLYYPQYRKGKSISKWGGFIENIEFFDSNYFGITEEEAYHMDPLVRQFLEVSAETMADAGYSRESLWNKNVGVFVGSRSANYAARVTEYLKTSIIGIGQNFIAALVSQVNNFRGQNLVIDTACSSSLMSIHLACQSLLSDESEMAIAGGVDILLDEIPYLILSEARALSPDGKCHTFDEKANGFVPGEGCGAVMLKLLDRAIADGDNIYAVINASAVNNDGNTMGITTPNPEAQYEVVKEALRKGGICPSTISYIESHGTGTMIGDPIELRALTNVFGEASRELQYCGIGSVKTNIGHLLSAAGIASFIKVVLSLWHKTIPPTLNCEKPNPRFEFKSSPFYPNVNVQNWKQREGIRRAGISSFGFGGTNVHVIVDEFLHEDHKEYTGNRKSHPPVVFDKKRYWLEKLSVYKECGTDFVQRSGHSVAGKCVEVNGNYKGLLEIKKTVTD